MATLIGRAEGLGIDLKAQLDRGSLRIHQVDPAELSPGEFVHRVVDEAEGGATVISIDSLNGYLHAMPEEERARMGQSGYAYFLEHFEMSRQAERLLEILGTGARRG